MKAAALRTAPNARSGAYGARPYNRAAEGGKALLSSIEQEIGGVDFFTREDLLHISAFSHVSTATRYAYIREALADLIGRGRVLERSRTELCLAGRARSYRDHRAMQDEFGPRIVELTRRLLNKADSVTVMDVVAAWATDPHLTENVKRVTVRNVLRAEVRESRLSETGFGRFEARRSGNG